VAGLRAGAAVLWYVIAALSFTAYFYSFSPVPAVSYALVIAAPLGQFLGRVPALAAPSPLARGVARCVGVAVIAGLALALGLYADQQR
jgi:hypothetical protein